MRLPLTALFVAHSLTYSHADPLMTKHVLWSNALKRPDDVLYQSWYNSSDLAWIPAKALPQVPAEAHVDIIFCTKPIFNIIGRTTGIWHAGLGFRVHGNTSNESYLYEYTSLEFEAAVAYPQTNKTTNYSENELPFPATALVDFHYDPSGEIFPVTGPYWKETIPLGSTTGAGLNLFAEWAFSYGMTHPRYLVWRILENRTEQVLLESTECFDFVLEGLRFLHGVGLTSLDVTEVPRTLVNVYSSAIEEHEYNENVTRFFASESKVLEEWIEIANKLPHIGKPSYTEWYWPAWFSPTSYAGGSGLLMQNKDFPNVYHRYLLQWPSDSKSPSTAPGLHRLSVPILN